MNGHSMALKRARSQIRYHVMKGFIVQMACSHAQRNELYYHCPSHCSKYVLYLLIIFLSQLCTTPAGHEDISRGRPNCPVVRG